MNIYVFYCVCGVIFFSSIANGEMKRELFTIFSVAMLKKLLSKKIYRCRGEKRDMFLVYANDAAEAAEIIAAKTGKSAIFADLSNVWICNQVLAGQNEFLADKPRKAELEDIANYRSIIPDLCDKECYITTIVSDDGEEFTRVTFVRAETQHKAMLIIQNRLASKYNSVVYWC
ncbi:MAG: hypothetical protein IJI14_17625 [Anaerolineaceae bacterium]|nr:hypothetical protein [Anaerolineaceae bacterium]